MVAGATGSQSSTDSSDCYAGPVEWVWVLALVAGCGRIAFDGNGDGDVSTTGARCRTLTITAGSDPLPSTYSIAVTIDHAALVAAGASAATGDDVRLLYQGAAIDRVIDVESSWNSITTRLWFRLRSALGTNASDSGYSLCYGTPATPLANPDNVYMVFDDFSSQTLDMTKWNVATPTGVTAVVSNGVLVLSGTADAASTNYLMGITSRQTFQANLIVAASFAIVSQSALAQQNWKATVGMQMAQIGLLSINSDISPNKRTQFWTSTWIDVGDSTLDARTFPPQRIGQSLTSDGMVQNFERDVVKGTRAGVANQSRSVGLLYGPDVPNETFTVTFEDVVIRAYVASDAEISVALAP